MDSNPSMPRARWEALQRRRAKKGLKTGFMDEKPELRPGEVRAWNAWRDLATSRPLSPQGTPMGIQFAEIEAWLNLSLVTDALDRHSLARHVKTLDEAWLGERDRLAKERVEENQPEEAPSDDGTTRSSLGRRGLPRGSSA